ncbi:hypothetical protein XENORESO_001633 [Xenotaenia resolanae]|uniref:Uncharacterized protein n=1 Tax=Xenotaenia resolanae TaxID=208358 RepID=A0ABV0WXY8_9TELE
MVAVLLPTGHEIKANLKADRTTIPVGGSVSLTCSVNNPAGLTYELFRGRPPISMTTVAGPSGEVFSTTEGGIYSCRGFKKEENFMTSASDDVIIYKIGVVDWKKF